MKHKWHKEIKAWADGSIIQFKLNGRWIDCQDNDPAWQTDTEYRIKPQPKEPQYLYVYKDYGVPFIRMDEIESPDNGVVFVGKIKLEE